MLLTLGNKLYELGSGLLSGLLTAMYVPAFWINNLGQSNQEVVNTNTSVAMVYDHEGVLVEGGTGEIMLDGGRREENLATALTTHGISVESGRSYQISCEGYNASTVTLSGAATGTLTNNGSDRQAFYVAKTATTTTLTLTVTGVLTALQVEDVTGRSNTAPSENILAATDYGYGVNGVKYYPTTNGNSVTNNIVTEASGYKLPSGLERGSVELNWYYREWAATDQQTDGTGSIDASSEAEPILSITSGGRAYYSKAFSVDAGKEYCLSVRIEGLSGDLGSTVEDMLSTNAPLTGQASATVDANGLYQLIFTPTFSGSYNMLVGIGCSGAEAGFLSIQLKQLCFRRVELLINKNARTDVWYFYGGFDGETNNGVVGNKVTEIPQDPIHNLNRYNAGAIYGDSFCNAYNELGSGLASRGIVVRPEGVGGNTLESIRIKALNLIPQMTNAYDFVLIQGGVNTLIGASTDPVAGMMADIAVMVASCNENNKAYKIINVAPWGNNANSSATKDQWTIDYNTALSSRYGGNIIDMYSVVGDASVPTNLSASYDSGDGLHLNPAGYAVMDDVIEAHLTSTPIQILAQPQRTELLGHSDGSASNYSLALGVSDAATPIRGFSNSIEFVDNAELRAGYKKHTAVIGEDYTFSAVIEMLDKLPPVVSADTNSGDFSVLVDGSLQAADVSEIGGYAGLYRVSVVYTATRGTNENTGIIKYTSQSARGFKATQYQMEDGVGVTTPIITPGSTPVVRDKDKFTISDFSNWAPTTSGIMLFAFTPSGDWAALGAEQLVYGGASANLLFRSANDDGLKATDGTGITSSLSGHTPGNEVIAIVVWDATLNALAVDYTPDGGTTWYRDATPAAFSTFTADALLKLGNLIAEPYTQRGITLYSSLPPGSTTISDALDWAEANADAEITKIQG